MTDDAWSDEELAKQAEYCGLSESDWQTVCRLADESNCSILLQLAMQFACIQNKNVWTYVEAMLEKCNDDKSEKIKQIARRALKGLQPAASTNDLNERQEESRNDGC